MKGDFGCQFYIIFEESFQQQQHREENEASFLNEHMCVFVFISHDIMIQLYTLIFSYKINITTTDDIIFWASILFYKRKKLIRQLKEREYEFFLFSFVIKRKEKRRYNFIQRAKFAFEMTV